jgi:hypothetical protein
MRRSLSLPPSLPPFCLLPFSVVVCLLLSPWACPWLAPGYVHRTFGWWFVSAPTSCINYCHDCCGGCRDVRNSFHLLPRVRVQPPTYPPLVCHCTVPLSLVLSPSNYSYRRLTQKLHQVGGVTMNHILSILKEFADNTEVNDEKVAFYCLVLSCLVLSCFVLSCPVLSCLVLSCLGLSCLGWPGPFLYCFVLRCLSVSRGCLVV